MQSLLCRGWKNRAINVVVVKQLLIEMETDGGMMMGGGDMWN